MSSLRALVVPSSPAFLLVAAVLLSVQSPPGAAFSPPSGLSSGRTARRDCRSAPWALAGASSNEDAGGGGGGGDSSSSSVVKEDMNPVTRASWFAVEAFGKVFGGGGGDKKDGADDGESASEVDLTRPPRSLDEALTRIRLDNDRSYFLSGAVDSLAYDEECTFADPFVSFDGRDRFVDNLANLGSFITEYDARMLNYEASDDGETVRTKVMVKLELNLPWKPVLAWPWGVTYSIDGETCLITRHEESWDIEPWEGVKQIFRKPTVGISSK